VKYFYDAACDVCRPARVRNYNFTGKERDAESGLDNFGKRYHASTMGRFMTPDPIMIMKQKLTDPQQWNMYSYSRNNPLGGWPTLRVMFCLSYFNLGCPILAFFARVGSGAARSAGFRKHRGTRGQTGRSTGFSEPGRAATPTANLFHSLPQKKFHFL